VNTAAALLDWIGVHARRRRFRAARVVVVSPHLDDAVLSLGATLGYAARHGADVTVVTVLAGDPAAATPAGRWDAKGGFRTAGEAAAARRREDVRACSRLRVTPTWLPLQDGDYGQLSAETISRELLPHLDWNALTLIPGYPLAHDDHKVVAEVVRGQCPQPDRLLSYVEQPYALWQEERPGSDWQRAPATVRDRLQKLRACRSYSSQLHAFAIDRLLFHVTRFEARRGGELVRSAG
jgi:LmbE family N-acetylglucosaminyl deacetylase